LALQRRGVVCGGDQVGLRLGHGSGAHRLGGAEQERLDVLVGAEPAGAAPWSSSQAMDSGRPLSAA